MNINQKEQKDIISHSRIYDLDYNCPLEKNIGICYSKEYDSLGWLEAYKYGVLISLRTPYKIEVKDLEILYKKITYNYLNSPCIYRNFNTKIPNIDDYKGANKKLEELCNNIIVPKEKDDFILLSAFFCKHFIRIHPFQEGNGRIGRIMMNSILLKGGFYPIFLDGSWRKEYYDCLQSDFKYHTNKFDNLIKEKVFQNEEDEKKYGNKL